jgi:hypothetical protein
MNILNENELKILIKNIILIKFLNGLIKIFFEKFYNIVKML